MAKSNEMQFSPVAGRGIEFAQDETHVFLKLPKDRAVGQPSASGKMTITSSSAGGWTDIPGTDGLRLNLNAGYSTKAART